MLFGCKKEEKDCDPVTPTDNNALTPFVQLLAETDFNGDSVNVKNLGSFTLDSASDFAFVGEIYPIDLKTFGRIFDCGSASTLNIRFHQNVDSNGRFAVGPFDHVLNMPSFWTRNTWIKTIVYYKHSTGEVRVYRDKLIAGTLKGVTIPAGTRENLIIGGSNWEGLFPNSSEPNSVMKTRNLKFYKGRISEAQLGNLLDKQ